MAQHMQRLQRDLRELTSHNFECSASNVFVQVSALPSNESTDFDHSTSASLMLCISEGPYAGAHYIFVISIPSSFPFKCPQMFSTVPIWHPNIDFKNGIVSLPLEWTPDLRLVDLAINLQMLMLNPSNLAVSNIEASLISNQNPRLFVQQIKETLLGVNVGGIEFPPISSTCEYCRSKAFTRRTSVESVATVISGASQSSRKRRTDVDLSLESEALVDIRMTGSEELDVQRRRSDVSQASKRLKLGVRCEVDSWDSGSTGVDMVHRQLSNSLDDYDDVGGGGTGAEDDDDNDGTNTDGSPYLTTHRLDSVDVAAYPSMGSYRSYSAKAERSRSEENLPILQHLSTIRRQIARTVSTDEWDFGDGQGRLSSAYGGSSRLTPRKGAHGDMVFRKSSVFVSSDTIRGPSMPPPDICMSLL